MESIFFIIKIKIEKTWVFIFYLFDFSFVIIFFLMGIDNAVSFIILLLSFFNFLNLKMVNYMWVEIDIDKTYFFVFLKYLYFIQFFYVI
jgi:hypothetical protein